MLGNRNNLEDLTATDATAIAPPQHRTLSLATAHIGMKFSYCVTGLGALATRSPHVGPIHRRRAMAAGIRYFLIVIQLLPLGLFMAAPRTTTKEVRPNPRPQRHVWEYGVWYCASMLAWEMTHLIFQDIRYIGVTLGKRTQRSMNPKSMRLDGIPVAERGSYGKAEHQQE